MKRKIIKLGQATYVMSLPSKWIRENKLDKGDYIEVSDEDGGLHLTTKAQRRKDHVQIDVRKLNHKLANGHLVQAYSKGYHTIEVIHEPNTSLYSYPAKGVKEVKTTSFLQKIAHQKFVGMEIVEQSDKRTVMKDLGGGINEQSAKNIFNRILFLLSQQAADVRSALEEGNKEKLEGISPSFLNTRRFILYYTRLLSLSSMNKDESTIRTNIINHFNRINSAYKSIINLCLKTPKFGFSKQALQALDLMNSHLQDVKDICLQYSREKAVGFLDNRVELWGKLLDQKTLKNHQTADYPIMWSVGTIMGALWYVVNECNALTLVKSKGQ